MADGFYHKYTDKILDKRHYYSDADELKKFQNRPKQFSMHETNIECR